MQLGARWSRGKWNVWLPRRLKNGLPGGVVDGNGNLMVSVAPFDLFQVGPSSIPISTSPNSMSILARTYESSRRKYAWNSNGNSFFREPGGRGKGEGLFISFRKNLHWHISTPPPLSGEILTFRQENCFASTRITMSHGKFVDRLFSL